MLGSARSFGRGGLTHRIGSARGFRPLASASRVGLLTAAAMLAFAANSVLNRLALADGAIDPVTFAGVRLISGAAVLALILAVRGHVPGRARIGGSLAGAAALLGYAVAFSLAYVDLSAATGALVLFASVQIGMLGRAVARGERPGAAEWAGFLIAILFLGYLLAPGVTAPEPASAALMVLAGLCWAAYTLIGRGSAAPLVDTAGNFVRCLPVALVLLVPALAAEAPSAAGWALAVASGAVASGLGYAVWYSVLPALTRTSAAFVQLTVPALAAVGGVLFIAEPLTPRLALSAAGVLGGVGLALWSAELRKRRGPAQG